MKKITEQAASQWKKLKRKWKISETVIPMWLGVILFVVVTVLSFMLFSVSRVSDNTEAIVWDYTFVQDIEETVDENSWLHTESSADLANPNGAYIRLTHTFAASDTDRILSIETDYAPIRMDLDHKVIYDNHFDHEEYVGNRYNAVVIPSGQERVVDLYMTQPFSGSFRSYTEEAPQGTNPAYSFSPILGLGAGLTVIGFIALLVSLFFILKNRQNKRFATIPLIAVVLGGKIVLEQLTRCTYMLNEPFWCTLYQVMPFFILCVMLLNLTRILGTSKRLIACLSVYSVLPLLLFAGKSVAFLQWGCVALYAAGFLLILMLCFELSGKIIQRVQYATACFSIAVFTLCTFAVAAAANIFSLTETRTALDIFILIVYLIFLYFIHFRLVLEPNEDYSAIGNCFSQWVKAFSSHVEQIYSADSMASLAAAATDEMCSTVERAAQELSGTASEPVKACAAVYADGGFTELYNRSLSETCNFHQVAEYYSHTGEKILICESYFDFIFCCNDQAHVIFHFENIAPQVSEFISGIAYLEYAIMNVAVQRYLSDMSEEQLFACQQMALSDAAAHETYDNASISDHISNVVLFTKILCEELGFDEEKSNIISSASALHDIGKFAIPKELMQKKGNLCKEERDMIDKHTLYGYVLLSSLPGKYMQAASYIALLHHAQYTDPAPDGIDAKYIQYARIVSVADVYDALTSKRNYKETWDFDKAYVYMNGLSGKKFDPVVIQAFNKRREDFAALIEGE